MKEAWEFGGMKPPSQVKDLRGHEIGGLLVLSFKGTNNHAKALMNVVQSNKRMTERLRDADLLPIVETVLATRRITKGQERMLRAANLSFWWNRGKAFIEREGE